MIARLLLATLLLLGSPVAGTAGEVRPARTDSYGDPLPAHAIARFGSLRFRCRFQAEHMEFSPDGRFLVMCDGSGDTDIFHWPSGLIYRRHSAEAIFGEALGMWDGVRAVRFTPDSRRAILMRSHKVVELDLYTHRKWDRLRDPFRTCRTISPDLRYVVADELKLGNRRGAGHFDSEYSLYDMHAAQPRPIRIDPRFGGDRTSGYAFSPDGCWLACSDGEDSAHSDLSVVTLMDLRTGAMTFTRSTPVDADRVEFSPDGRTLLVHGPEGAVVLPLVSHPDSTPYPRFTSTVSVLRPNEPYRFQQFIDGWRAMLVTDSRGWVCRIDVRTRVVRVVAKPASLPNIIRLSPDGRTLATLGRSHTVPEFWNVADGTPAAHTGHTGSVHGLVFSADGRRLHSSSGDGTIRTWDATPRILRRPSAVGPTLEERYPGREVVVRAGWDIISDIRLHPQRGTLVIAEGSDDGTVEWEGGDTANVRSWGRRTDPRNVALSAEGGAGFSVGVTRSQDAKVRIADPRSGEALREIDTGHAVVSVCGHPDGRTLLVSSYVEGDSTVWDLLTGLRLKEVPPGRGGLTSRLWGSGDSPASVRETLIRDRSTGAIRARIAGTLAKIVPSADERALVGISWNRDVPGGSRIARYDLLSGHLHYLTPKLPANATWDSQPVTVAVSPDGKLVAVGYGNGEIHLIDQRPHFRDPARPAAPREWQSLWDGLARSDFDHRAFGNLLSQFPAGAVAELRNRRRMPERLSPDRLPVLLNQFDDDDYLKREAATREVRRSLPTALPGLEAFLKGKPSAEAGGRVRRLVEEGAAWPPSGARLREMRVVGVLERIGSPEAKALLREYAAHPDGAIATSAKDSLVRLRK